MSSAHNQEVKSDPQSDIIAEGTKCNHITSCVMTFANSYALISERKGI